MKKKNMKPIVLSALLALSFGAVSVGTTFALFTDVAEANVAVKAGEVKVTNEIQILEAKSLNDYAETVTGGTDVTYINGGTANVDNTTGKVTISRWTPGDSVTLQTTPVNGSNVKTKMRLRVVMSGDLAPALKVTGIKNNTNAFVISGKKTYCTAWTLTEAGVNPDAYDVKIEFPDSDNGEILFGSENKDNKYQGKEAEIHIYYEAVQGNAAIDDLLERVNSRLAEEEIIDGKANDTMHEAFADLEGLLTPADAKSNHFVWNYETDAFAREAAVTADQYKYFKVADDYVTDFSMYASEAWTHTDVALTGLGFDAGAHTDIASITYTGAAEARENIIRTNGGSLTVNAAQDTIRHYGNADTVNIVAVASNSYHVYGVVPFIQISKGRVAIEETGKVTGIHVANVQTVEQNGEITKTANTFSHDVVLTLNGEDVKLTRDTAGTNINDPILVCEVQEDENSDEYIWLFGDGTIENAQVYVTDSKDAPDTSVGSTTTQDNASAAAKAIANNAVNTGTEAAPVYEAQESGITAEEAKLDSAGLDGSGTEADPFLIYNFATMQKITDYYDEGYKYFKVAMEKTVDGEIDCTGWAPVYLNGSFDGNGVHFKNVTANLFQAVGHKLENQNITLKNFDATMNVSDNRTYGAAALVKNIFNGGTTTFDNVDVHGYLEGYWNMGSYYNYGTANYDDEGCDYEVVFNDCVSDATLVCASGNTIGGLFGHSFEGKDNSFTMRVNNSRYEGQMYLTTKTGKGNKYFGMTSDYNNAHNHFFFDGAEDTFTNGDAKNAGAYTNSVKINNVVAAKSADGYRIAKQEGAAKIVATVTAQLTAYDNQNVKIANLAGITMVLASREFTSLDDETIKVLDLFNGVALNKNASKYDANIVNDILNVELATNANYKDGTIRLQVNQYDANGQILSAGTLDIATCSGPTSSWIVK